MDLREQILLLGVHCLDASLLKQVGLRVKSHLNTSGLWPDMSPMCQAQSLCPFEGGISGASVPDDPGEEAWGLRCQSWGRV